MRVRVLTIGSSAPDVSALSFTMMPCLSSTIELQVSVLRRQRSSTVVLSSNPFNQNDRSK
jgi:hypothetical protein